MIMTLGGNTATGLDFKSFRVRGINVAAIDIPLATDLIQQLATSAQGAYVTVTGAHGIVKSVYSERARKAHEQAAMVVPDGMPLVWLGRLLGFNSIGRVYGPDLMESVFRESFASSTTFSMAVPLPSSTASLRLSDRASENLILWAPFRLRFGRWVSTRTKKLSRIFVN